MTKIYFVVNKHLCKMQKTKQKQKTANYHYNQQMAAEEAY